MSINTLNVYAVQNVIFLILTAIRLLVLAALTGFARVKTKQFHAPEDNRNGGEASSFGGAEGSGGMTLPDRVMRAHYNAIENDLVWFLSYSALGASGANVWLIIVCNTVYTVCRIGHVVCYLKAIQPFRALCFLGGVLTCAFMMLYAFVQVFFTYVF